MTKPVKRLKKTVAALAAIILVGCGSESNNGSSSAALSSGVLIDGVVGGVAYRTNTQSGFTDENGLFNFLEGEAATFSIGGIELGSAAGADVVTPVELAGAVSAGDPAVINLLILLQSLDSDGDHSNGITISDAVRTSAAGVDLDFTSAMLDDDLADLGGLVGLVNTLTDGAATVVSETEALNNFFDVLVEMDGAENVRFDFPDEIDDPTAVVLDGGVELLVNGDFSEGVMPWIGNAANVVVDGDNSFNQANVEQAGDAVDVNLSQVVSITEGESYVLSYTASSDTSRTLIAGIGLNEDPFTNVTETVTLTTEPQTFTHLFVANFGSDNSRVLFDMGADIGAVTIDDVSLIGPEELAEYLTNGDFSDGANGWIGNAANGVEEGGNGFNQADVDEAGESFNVNLSQVVALTEGETYTLTYSASTDTDTGTRTLIAGIGLNEAPWTSVTETVTLTSDLQTFTHLFVANFGSDNSRVLFDMGADTGVVVIDDVSLTGPAIGDDGTGDDGTGDDGTGDDGTGDDGTGDDGTGDDGTGDDGVVELAVNGDFEAGFTSWIGNVAEDDNNLVMFGGDTFVQANVMTAGNSYDVNLSQLVEITQGETYSLTFDASSDAARTIVAGIGLNEAPWTNTTETVNLSTETQTFELTLTATDFGSANSRIIFDIGAETGIVTLDNVSLSVAVEADSAHELLTNGDFSDGANGWIGNAANGVEEGGNGFNRADVATAGEAFNVNLSQVVALTEGETYTLTYSASTDTDTGTRTLIAGIGLNEAPWTNVTETVTLTSDLQIFTHLFVANFGSDNSRVLFDMGADTGVVVIDDVSLVVTPVDDGGDSGNDGDGDATGQLAVNGGFESGDFTGWDVFTNGGTASVENQDAASGSFAAHVVAAAGNNPVLKQSNLAVGVVAPGDTVFISFDMKGTAGAGGVIFPELFSEFSGGGASNEILATIASPTAEYTNYSYEATAGAEVGGGITLQLGVVCGGVDGCFADVFIDNVFISINGAVVDDDTGDTGGDDGTGTELSSNGDFEAGFTSWIGNVAEDDNNLVMFGGDTFVQANVMTAGNSYDVNLSQLVEITQGETYSLTFDASSDAARTIVAGIGLNEAPWTNTTETVNLSTETQTFELTLTATDFGGANSRIIFDIGAETGLVTLDNVSLSVAVEADSAHELLTNGDFSDGANGWIGNAANGVEEGGNGFNRADVATAGEAFNVNLSQVVALTEGETYTLTYSASTDTDTGTRTLIAGIGLNEAPWTNVTETVTLTSDLQIFTHLFVANFGSDNSRVLFDMGADTGVVVIDDVSLVVTPVDDGGDSGNDGDGDATGQLAVNGGFESGDFTGWDVFTNGGTASVENQDAASGSFAAHVVAAAGNNPVLKQSNLAVGVVAPGDTVFISFDMKGTAGAGGVIFPELFSEFSGGGASNEILATIASPTAEYTNYSYEATAGAEVGGGITLQLGVVCGGVDGCFADVFIDNVFISINGAVVDDDTGDTGGDDGTGTELSSNGDFEAGFTSWIGNVAEDDNNLVMFGGDTFVQANVMTAGNSYDVNLSQLVEITQGETYSLTFDASSDAARTIVAGIGLNEAPWTNTTETVNLSTETQTFELTLTATNFGGANSRIIFDIGAETGIVTLDNVSLSVAVEADSAQELLTNGDFSDGANGWIGNAANGVEEGGNGFNRADVATAGEAFNVNLSQVVALTEGETYTLTYSASTDTDTGTRTLIAGIGLNEAPWTNVTETVTLTSDLQIFTHLFVANFGSDNSRVLFDMGADTGVVVIDDVSLVVTPPG